MPNFEIIFEILPILHMDIGITLTSCILMVKISVYFLTALDFILHVKVS